MKEELRVLNYFLAIAREENITRAAQPLHVTQRVLSRQMMQLEEELGVKLFTRRITRNHKILRFTYFYRLNYCLSVGCML